MDRIRRSSIGRRALERVLPYLPEMNFIFVHYLYFIGTCIFTSIIFYVTSTPAFSIQYTDSLFLVVSAMSEAGLNTVNLSQTNTFQQWLLWMHIMGGSAIWVSIFVIHFRKRAFEKRFGSLIKSGREQIKRRRNSFRSPSSGHFPRGEEPTAVSDYQTPAQSRDQITSVTDGLGTHAARPEESQTNTAEGTKPMSPTHPEEQHMTAISGHTGSGLEHITFSSGPPLKYGDASRRRRGSVIGFKGVGASPVTTSFRRPGQSFMPERSPIEKSEQDHGASGSSPFPWHRRGPLVKDVLGRNSQFHNLTLEEREQLGGVEYRAITLLAWVVPVYFVLWQLLGALGIGAWMAYHAAEITEANGINPWWNGAFNAVSAFNNSGMSLLDQNMIPFQTAMYPVLTMGLLVLAGNTAFPVFLRLILWCMCQLCPNTTYYCDRKDTLRFVLDHPRRVYTNLFPSTPTWWLVLTLVVLNGTDWVAFELLNLGNPAISSIPLASRVLDGFFQALAVRSGGFYIVPIPSLRIGVQVLYVLMMYISVYPVVITMRNSNVYEERSLGIYADDPGLQRERQKSDPELGPIGHLKRTLTFKSLNAASETRGYFVRQQMRGQLAHDLSWLAIAVLLIVCIENSSCERDPVTYSVFNVVFEVVSGYGCVGITTGLPDEYYSFSGGWHVASKLILCAVMIRGRHRGLPVAIDRAVLLPGEHLGSTEEEDHEIRRGFSREGPKEASGGLGGVGIV